MNWKQVFANSSDLEIETDLLVYADWLEEHGEYKRAEFIRWNCRSLFSLLVDGEPYWLIYIHSEGGYYQIIPLYTNNVIFYFPPYPPRGGYVTGWNNRYKRSGKYTSIYCDSVIDAIRHVKEFHQLFDI